jgi:hypothetical protein
MSSSSIPGELASALESLAAAAESVAAPMAAAALRSTSLGRERAILRLIGVEGVDREGRPLAAEVVDRYVGGNLNRLAGGVGLPFAVALLEYDSSPQALALDVAAGRVDLALEAALLAREDRREAASRHLERLFGAAMERIDANRTARHELLEVLGDEPAPWIGAVLGGGAVDIALAEAQRLARVGVGFVGVAVPAGRELATRLIERGQDVAWRPRPAEPSEDSTPVGSQRGLARLRAALDEAAAERGAYVRLGITPTALATPESAVVAGFERVDLIDLDPLTEVVVTGVDPDRALADFVFAARMADRAGVAIQIGAGPLTVAPDLDAGVNSDPATRSGRALALQLVAVAIARGAGIEASRLLVGALPAWIAGESHPAARAVAEVALRRRLLPESRLAFVEPPLDETARWPAILAAVLPGDGVGLILKRAANDGEFVETARAGRAAAVVARELDSALSVPVLRGVARDHAAAAIDAAVRLLELISLDGWRAVTGSMSGGWGHLGADSVAPMAGPSSPDPLDRALG